MMTKEQILAEAKSLEPADQEQLAEAILMQANGMTADQIDALWATEIQNRIDRADRGEGSSAPVEEVVKRLRQKANR
jgi:hypothetical protein